MNEEKIRDAFKRIKEDMNYFFEEIQQIKQTLEDLKNPTQKPQIPTFPTQIPTPQHQRRALKPQILPTSTRNDGVPTNQQTNQQTNQHPPISSDKFVLINYKNNQQTKYLLTNPSKPDKISKLQQASQILSSLDELKKEVRSKFKKLTNQEMLIFSTIYQLEDLKIEPSYEILAEKLKLSEISVRDYVRKIINKGIPVDKIKTPNNKITLSISKDLKKIASLNTILQLREL